MCATEDTPAVCATEDIPAVCATEDNSAMCATEDTPVVCATEDSPAMCATEDNPAVCVTEYNPAMYVTRHRFSECVTIADIALSFKLVMMWNEKVWNEKVLIEAPDLLASIHGKLFARRLPIRNVIKFSLKLCQKRNYGRTS